MRLMMSENPTIKEDHMSSPQPFERKPVVPHPLVEARVTTTVPTNLQKDDTLWRKPIPDHIVRPPYSETGKVPFNAATQEDVYLHTPETQHLMRQAARLARRALDLACSCAVSKPGVTTDQIDTLVHEFLIDQGAYPSPLNYCGFPKSLCSSINEVICHGIPDTRPLHYGDVVSFDVSCYINGVHGDNCATIIVGDAPDDFAGTKQEADGDNNHSNMDSDDKDWRGVPYKTNLTPGPELEHFTTARRLVRATRESLYAAIQVCRPGNCLTDIGKAIQGVADGYGYQSVEQYRGHGIFRDLHCAPYVKHFLNEDRLILQPGMIFTIEPMLVIGQHECYEWPQDGWTVATLDNSLAAQFEHTVLITENSVEILTLPELDK